MLAQFSQVSRQLTAPTERATLRRTYPFLRGRHVFKGRYDPIVVNVHCTQVGSVPRDTFKSPRLNRRGVCFAGPEKTDDLQFSDSIGILFPLMGLLALFVLGGTLIGTALPSIGLILAVLAVSAVTGTLDKISAAYGVSPVNSAIGISGVLIGILAIPSFLKLGVLFIGVLFLMNLLLGAGMSITGQSVDVDPSDAIIDVDYDTVDD